VYALLAPRFWLLLIISKLFLEQKRIFCGSVPDFISPCRFSTSFFTPGFSAFQHMRTWNSPFYTICNNSQSTGVFVGGQRNMLCSSQLTQLQFGGWFLLLFPQKRSLSQESTLLCDLICVSHVYCSIDIHLEPPCLSPPD